MSSAVVGIGACVMDTLVSVPHYPKEDTKLRAASTKQSGGGPTATGIVAAAKLGVCCDFIGTLSEDSVGDFLINDFKKYGVGTSGIDVLPGYRPFSSTVWLSSKTTSRTCVFDKGNLPGTVLDDAKKQLIKNAKVLMVDGNDLNCAVEAAAFARQNGVLVLYDAGGLYEGIERLLPLCDILIPSEEFALAVSGQPTAEQAAKTLFLRYSPKVVVITQGKRGGILFDGQQLANYPIYPAKVVDSNGAGDVFHGAFAAGLVLGYSYLKCCHFASAVSGLKCTGVGARESVPDFNTVKDYLRRNGYEL